MSSSAIKLLHEACELIVTVELQNGETYRGKLLEMEDNMNCQLGAGGAGGKLTHTDRSGQVSHLEQVFIRGSQIRFIAVPDMLKYSPVLRNADPRDTSVKGLGRSPIPPEPKRQRKD
jgi:small nuclear ribonucleoprotein D3